MDKQLQKLRQLLEGKRVLRVEEPYASEAICKLVLDDGTSFRLHATDLGFWMEETASASGLYHSFDALMTDYGHHVGDLVDKRNYEIRIQYSGDVPGVYYEAPNALIVVEGERCKFIAPDGKEFVGVLKSFSDYENSVLAHPKGRELLAEAAEIGDCWRMLFSKQSEGCPPELIWTPPSQ